MDKGDFNFIINEIERMGGSMVYLNEMEDFKNCIEDSNLNELKVIGCFFIWNNKYEYGGRIFFKYDRILVNENWFDKFFISFYQVLFEGYFDYCFFVICIMVDVKKINRIFKFFNMWIKYLEFMGIVVR